MMPTSRRIVLQVGIMVFMKVALKPVGHNGLSADGVFLKGHALCPAHDLACQLTVQGIDRAARQGVILGEEEGQDLMVGVSTIRQQCDDTGDEAVGVVFLGTEEGFRDITDTVTLDCDDLVLAEQVQHLGHNNAEAICNFWEIEQWLICW